MAHKAWAQKNHDERKWFLVRLIGGLAFLLAGLVFGIVSLCLNGWDFAKFVTNPTVLLVVLVGIALGITMISLSEVK